MIPNIYLLLLVGAAVGAAAGYLGAFMVLKRMSLVGDALSHVALPGMALALMFHYSPIVGAFIALSIAVIGVWLLEKKSKIYPEALIGIFFTVSLSVGILITPEPELLEALFGDIQSINLTEGILATIISVGVIVVLYLISKKLILGIVSPELAKSTRINLNIINLVYLLLVGTTVALGIKFVGTLLTGALVIIPAAAAKNIARGLTSYSVLSIFFGMLASVIGIIFSTIYNFPPGPIIVLSSALIFCLTFIRKLF